MALQVSTLPRVFKWGKDYQNELTDPNIEMEPEQVMNFYAGTYPELTTATLEGPMIDKGKLVYKFVTTVGTKG